MIHSLNKIQGQSLENEKNFASIDTMYQYWHFLIHQVVKLGQSQKIRFGLQRTGLIFLPAVMLVLLTVACGSSDPATETPTKSNEAAQAPAVSPINVQTTTTVLADMARVIGGDLIEATSLVPPGADVHIYQVSPSQMIALSEASLIISNGSGLDGFLDSALENAKSTDAIHVVASQGLTPEALVEMEFPSDGADTEHHGEELAEEIEHLIHEVEEGAISPEDAVEQIEQLLGGHEGEEHETHEDAHGHDEEGLEDELKEIIHEVEEGHLTAESAIESMEQVIEQHHGEELAEEIEHLIHEVEEGAISPEDAVEQIEQLLGGHEGEEHETHEDAHGHDEEGLEDELKEIIHEVEEGHLTAESAIESMEQVIEQHHGEEGHKEDGGHHGHGHDAGDPHFWLDPILAVHYVEQISEGLVQADPTNAQVYSENSGRYIQELRDLDEELREELSQVPQEYRHLVTFHDAYGYFARRYGWEVSAFVPGHAGDVTPQDILRVIDKIQSDGIPAIFAEPQFAEAELNDAAQTTGVKVGLIRALVDDTEPTYIDMMRSNVRSMVDLLK